MKTTRVPVYSRLLSKIEILLNLDTRFPGILTVTLKLFLEFHSVLNERETRRNCYPQGRTSVLKKT